MQHLQALRARLKTQQHAHAAAPAHADVPAALTDPFLAPGLYDCERPNDYQAICAERARALAPPAPPPPPPPPLPAAEEAPAPTCAADAALDGVAWEPPAGWQDPYAVPEEGDGAAAAAHHSDDGDGEEDAEREPDADAALDGVAWTLPAAISAAQARALARTQATAFARAFVAALEERQRRRRRQKHGRRRTPRATATEGAAAQDEDDVGARLLQKMGWVPGTGLGA